MNDVWLISNPRSKACDESLVTEMEGIFAQAGRTVVRSTRVGEDELPDEAAARAAGVNLIAILSGDGTISAAAQRLGQWDGTLLVLPGGTMNLLSHALHGDLGPAEIAQAALAGEGASGPVPVIRREGITAYSGIIVGPSSAWADVREDMRNLDIAAIGADAAQAVAATFSEPGVRMEGAAVEYPAIYLEPRADGLSAFGVKAEGASDLLAHGWAWLTGDFRNGPCTPLGVHNEIALGSQSDSFDILIDGERGEAPNPATFRAAKSDIRFHALRGAAQWP